MTFDLAWFDFFFKDRIFGFGFLTYKGENIIRSLFSIYWNDRELMIDLFWIRILTYIVLIGYKEE